MSLKLLLALALSISGAAADCFSEDNNSTLALKKLIVLSRHGIRVPYPANNLGQPTYSSFRYVAASPSLSQPLSLSLSASATLPQPL